MIRVIDNFLTERSYNDLLVQVACGPFDDEANPVDGVVYPLICKFIPSSVSDEVDDIFGAGGVEFLRASPEGVYCPHPVHHDGSMGRLSLMIYTSSVGGTAVMAHKRTGCMVAPQDEALADVIASDCSDIDAWEIIEIAEAKPNRAAIFDSRLMHAAQPFGGFGSGATARAVYTRFIP